ncbi:MAG: class I lanthipeptide [Deltaproteobacteria bacterium]|nr:class I lanthipeptide [Deltaproteobacteria bacterium]
MKKHTTPKPTLNLQKHTIANLSVAELKATAGGALPQTKHSYCEGCNTHVSDC